jgi:hypothetical protein
MTEREHIALCVPTLSGKADVTLAAFCLQLSALAPDKVFTLLAPRGVMGHDAARNKIVKRIRELPHISRTLWLDDDIEVKSCVLHLFEIDADIVTGVYPLMGCNQFDGTGPNITMAAYKVWDPERRVLGSWMPTSEATEPEPLVGCGFGCCVVRASVLRDERMDYPGSTPEKPAVFRFDRDPDGTPKRGEDLDFCQRALALGYTCVGDPKTTVDHFKDGVPIFMVAQLMQDYAARVLQLQAETTAASLKE